MKKKNAAPVTVSTCSDRQIEEAVQLECGMELPTVAISADNGLPEMSPLEAAILSISGEVQITIRLAKEMNRQAGEIKNHAAMMESACKLMAIELSQMKQHLPKKE